MMSYSGQVMRWHYRQANGQYGLAIHRSRGLDDPNYEKLRYRDNAKKYHKSKTDSYAAKLCTRRTGHRKRPIHIPCRVSHLSHNELKPMGIAYSRKKKS